MIGFTTNATAIDACNSALVTMRPFPCIEIMAIPIIAGGVFAPMPDHYLQTAITDETRIIDLDPVANLIAELGGLSARVEMTSDQFTPQATP
jgi:hypothetical protein